MYPNVPIFPWATHEWSSPTGQIGETHLLPPHWFRPNFIDSFSISNSIWGERERLVFLYHLLTFVDYSTFNLFGVDEVDLHRLEIGILQECSVYSWSWSECIWESMAAWALALLLFFNHLLLHAAPQTITDPAQGSLSLSLSLLFTLHVWFCLFN